MFRDRIDVIATTVSGSVQDWKKIDRIVPLFREHGLEDVRLHVVDSHAAARERARSVVGEGGRIPISAGGSGTFRSVLEGCIDSGVPLAEIRLGFLRKGSADLIGKVLGMPDDVEAAAAVFGDAIPRGTTVACDVLRADGGMEDEPPRHFVGYGGVGIFGRIPHFTENRFMKWYKGILGQVFGDLGPFTTGMGLAFGEHLLLGPFRGRDPWRVDVDGATVAEERYHALVILNGYLGPELAFTDDPLGSGHFHVFGLRDAGLRRLPGQLRRARSGAIVEDTERWGLESFVVRDSLEIFRSQSVFPANVDGSTLRCREGLRVRRVDRIALIARESETTEGADGGDRMRESEWSR